MSVAGSQTPSRDILGVDVACLNWDAALDLMDEHLIERQFLKLGWLNAHCANVAQTDPAYREALRDFLVLPDGFGVDIASKVFYGDKFPANLNGTDFVPRLLQHIVRPLRVALLGGRPGIADEAAKSFHDMAPQHDYDVISDGYFTPDDLDSIQRRLADCRPDILLIAMGVPLQELFIARHIGPEHCTIACAVGALLDFQAGHVERAPKWVRDLRMEWLYRLVQEPKRLAKRYLVGNPLFLWRVGLQRLKTGNRP